MIAFTVDWPRDSSRPTTMTTAPNPASPSAIERPMPDVAAGHENDSTVDSVGRRPMLQAAPGRVPDPRVAAGDGELQRAVDELRDHAGDVITARRPAAAASPIRRNATASSGLASFATP